MSISLKLTTGSSMVTLVAESSGNSVTLYRRIGGANANVLSVLDLVSGVASYSETPAEKVLLSYYGVNDLGEVSREVTTVLPLGYSLARPTLLGDVHLGTMVFNTVDEDGTVWTMSELDGWWTTPSAIIPTALRAPNEDGDYDSDGRYDARVLKFEGTFLPASPALTTVARTKLVSAINAVRRVQRLTLFDTEPTYLDVRLSGQPQIDTYRSTGITNFSVGLRAADPVKKSVYESTITLSSGASQGGRSYPKTYPKNYGALMSPSSAQLLNTGNYPAYPRIVITGPVQTPRIENVTTGQFVQLNITLTSTQFIVIDMRSKTVLLQDSVSRRSTLVVGSTWWQVVPGANEIRFTTFTSGTGANAKLYARSSWIG